VINGLSDAELQYPCITEHIAFGNRGGRYYCYREAIMQDGKPIEIIVKYITCHPLFIFKHYPVLPVYQTNNNDTFGYWELHDEQVKPLVSKESR